MQHLRKYNLDFANTRMALCDASRKQGFPVAEIYRNIRRIGFSTYQTILAYSRWDRPMVFPCQDFMIWHDIKEACDKLGIVWEGWKNLPELPEDDEF